MKKRLLITSIVMMLVVAVALSTATYAWFTSNASVTASTVTLTASTNDAAALGISWINNNYGTSITDAASGTSATLDPMAPIAYTAGTTVATTAGDNKIAFNTATIKSDATLNKMVFGADGSTATPYVWNDGTGEGKGHTSFYVKNLAPANTTNLTVTVTADIQGAAADLVRIAVFVDDTLLTVLANDTVAEQVASRAKVAKGAISGGTAVDTYAAAAVDATSATAGASFSLNANTSAEIVVMMWLDGALFDETRSTDTATVALSFGGVKANA